MRAFTVAATLGLTAGMFLLVGAPLALAVLAIGVIAGDLSGAVRR